MSEIDLKGATIKGRFVVPEGVTTVKNGSFEPFDGTSLSEPVFVEPAGLTMHPDIDEVVELQKAIDEDWRSVAHGDDVEYELVEIQNGYSGRWSESMTSIVRSPSGQLLAFDWNRGLTEYQEDDCEWPRPRKVKAVQKQITITEYEEDK